MQIEISIEKISKRNMNNVLLYNFSVEGDESYVANGIVSHNCRCSFVDFLKEDREEVEGIAEDSSILSDITDALKSYKKKESLKIQSIIFDKDVFNSKDMVMLWIKKHNLRSKIIIEKDSSYRVRQVNSSLFVKNSFRLKKMSKGVKLISGKLKVE